MYEQEKQEMIETALEMKRNNLIALAGGNVSLRMPNGDIIITPSGMSYEIMTPDDMIVFDKDKNIIEGTRKQSVDTPALFYIFDNMPEVNAAYSSAICNSSRTCIRRIAGMPDHSCQRYSWCSYRSTLLSTGKSFHGTVDR